MTTSALRLFLRGRPEWPISVVVVAEQPNILLIGDGRLARHLRRYFAQLSLNHAIWSRRLEAQKLCPKLDAVVHLRTHALLAISDRAIEPFIRSRPELGKTVRIHFSGRLASPLAIGAHPLFSFAETFYEREFYERIPFVIDQDSPRLASLIPGLPNPCFFIEPKQRERYHALCVLAGNFTTLLWRKLLFELDVELGMPREQLLPYLESITRGLGGTGAPLSGPLSRGDQTTLQCNLEALKGDPFEQVYSAFVSAYEQQGKLAAAVGRKDWLEP
jgi:2-dehydropantoate 2-reductase